MQTILAVIGAIALNMAAGAASAEPLSDQGVLVCSMDGDPGLIGWTTEPDGTVKMMGIMAGDTAQFQDGGLVILRDSATIILRQDQAVFVDGDMTLTAKCSLATDDVIGLAEAMK